MRYTFLTVAFAPLLVTASNVGRCTGTIASLDDVAEAQKCTTVNINAFTVPSGKTFALSLLSGTVVTMLGDVKFGVSNWPGPLFSIEGTSITFNGNGQTFDGQGASYWDGQGAQGVTKPHPMMKIKMSGTYKDVKVLNSPAHVYSVSNPAMLTMSKLTIDNSAGNAANSKSGGKPAAHNTDGFDVSTDNLTIEDSTITNQDDCLALNRGTNIIFRRNTCIGGHGISIGSVASGSTVKGIQILDNTITDNDQALRIKTQFDATGASVSGVTYSGNTATGIRKYGVIVDQAYPTTLGKDIKNGVSISDINFTGTNNIAVTSSAERVAVNCGTKCTGTWDWTKLTVTGGKAGSVYNYAAGIKAGTY